MQKNAREVIQRKKKSCFVNKGGVVPRRQPIRKKRSKHGSVSSGRSSTMTTPTTTCTAASLAADRLRSSALTLAISTQQDGEVVNYPRMDLRPADPATRGLKGDLTAPVRESLLFKRKLI